MRWYAAEPVFGHGAGSNEIGYTRILEAGKSGSFPMFIPDEKLIDLRPYALTQSPAILASMSTIQGDFYSSQSAQLEEQSTKDPGSVFTTLATYESAQQVSVT